MLLSSSNNSSPLIGKRRGDCQYSQDDDISLETSQLMIRSPIDNNKRPRYEATNWTLDNLCNHPCSPLADIDLEVKKKKITISKMFHVKLVLKLYILVCI